MVSKEVLLHTAGELRKQTSAFFINNWRVTLLILIAVIAGGMLSLASLPKESDPEVVIPIASVSIGYPGASPSDVEKLITSRVEDRLQTLENVKEINSSSGSGFASIIVEFEASADLDESIRNLRDEMEKAKSILPEDATDPTVTEVRMEDTPIVTFSLLGNVPPDELKLYGEDLQDRLENITGVSKVPLYGIEREELQIYIDINALEGYGLSMGQVIQAIRANHADMPFGSLETDDYTYQLTLKGQFADADSLKELPIANISGEQIYLRDMAEVRKAFAKKQSESLVYKAETGETKRAVTLQLYKRSGGNILDIVDKANAEVEAFKKEILPPGMDVFVTNDYSVFIRDDIQTLGRSGIQTSIIIFIILFIALGFKEAFLTGFTLPLIFMLTFLGLSVTGETLNSLVLFSLILSLGLIVDTSIVIMEGIHHFHKERQLPAKDAALLSVKTYKAPLISSTLTTVSAFVPMALMTGIMGAYIRHIPFTVVVALTASLLVALYLLPAIAVRAFRKTDFSKPRKEPLLSHLINPLKGRHEKLLRSILPSRAKRWMWVLAMVVLFIGGASLPAMGLIKTQMFGGIDVEFFYVNIEAPTGAGLEEVRKVTDVVSKEIENIPYVENYVLVLGGQTTISMQTGMGTSNSSNIASFTVNLVPKEERDVKSFEVTDALRETLGSIKDAKITVQELGAGPPSGSSVALRVIGDDLTKIQIVAEDILAHLETIDGVLDPSTNIENGTGEFQFSVDRDALSYYGLTASQVGSELRSAIYGNDSVKIIRDGEEMPIAIRLDFREEDCLSDTLVQIEEARDHVTVCGSQPESLAQIENLLIATPKGTVPLSELASVDLKPAIQVIRHKDRENIVSVEASNREDVAPVLITEKLQEYTDQMELPSGVRVEYGGELEEIAESYQSLWNALIVGLVLISFFLVLQFRSFRQPFIILFALPLALIGVFVGLLIMGRNFSFPGFIGIVALAGVVVNDSIVLIDCINSNVRIGLEKIEAVIAAAKDRLQPIILTTVTTAMGVLPLAFADDLWADLAWTIVFGIIFSTVLSLIMVPIFYIMLEGKRKGLPGDEE